MDDPLDVPTTAVVTGAGRGIGRSLALGLAGAGYDVALLGRTPEHLDRVVAEIKDAGSARALAVPAELTDPASVRRAVAEIESALAGVGLLVNNAGVVEDNEGPFAEDDVLDSWQVIENNLRGPLNITHALLPGMLARGGGRVVNLNSGAGHRATEAYTGYAISKGALSRLTVLLDAQYHDRGIRTFDLAPGVVPTDMTTGMPVHRDRTEWTPVAASVELLLAIARGELDRLSGRFLRAGVDTPAELVSHTYEILVADARRLRMVPYGANDPIGT